MNWERITSRDNRLVHTVTRLASSAKARNEAGLYVCEGKKLLLEALRDGVTIDAWERDGWWFNVRASNTEPLIRLNLEAKDKAQMEAMRDEVLAFIRS